jgi:hypothetical protein
MAMTSILHPFSTLRAAGPSAAVAFFLLVAGLFATCRAGDASTGPRAILICTSSQLSPELRKAVDDFTSHGSDVPLFKALISGNEATGVEVQASLDLMDPKAYNTAAHNHLVVIGLQSQDTLLAKVWGYNASIDESKQTAYSLGWGYMKGDIGWVESDWNPFLHSQRIKTAPEDTVTVKITGTTEAGVAAALKAFHGGMLNGFVVAGTLTRPQTTLLDMDPSTDPAPGTLPAQITIGTATATLAGWTQVPQQEYRAVLESGGVEPEKMWRYKYLATGILEEKPIVRYLGGVSHMAFGNAIDIIKCHSAEDASSAAQHLSQISYKGSAFTSTSLSGGQPAWQCPQATDESMEATWNVIVTSSGPYLFLSTLPSEGTSAVIAAVTGGNAPDSNK